MRCTLTQLGTLLALLVAACAPPGPPTAPPPPEPERRHHNQVLRVAAPALVSTPTPRASRSNVFQLWPLYDNLTRFGPDYEVRPSVAERWEVAPDGLSWTFTLRTDLTFSTGEPLTAEDVAFTLTEVLEHRWPQTAYFGLTAAVEALDTRTVRIITRARDASVPHGAPFLWVLPKRYYQEVGFEQFALRPVGSGPYELVEFQPGELLRYRKRAQPHPFRTPVAEELVIRVLANPTQVLNGLVSNQIDIAAGIAWSGKQAATLQERGVEVIQRLSVNLQVAMPQGSYELRATPLRDRRVRLALNYAVDRQRIATALYRGFARPTGQVAVPGSLFYDPNVPPWPYDPAQARRLLAEAGYPRGFTLPGGFDYSLARGQQQLVAAIQDDLRAVGVHVEAIGNEESVFVDKAYGRRNLPKGDLWLGSHSDDNGFFTSLRTFYGCDRPAGADQRALLYCNPTWDHLLDLAAGEPDAARRRHLFLEANRLFREDVPVIFLLDVARFVVHSPKIKGLEVPLLEAYNFDSAYRVR
ncbi:MAG: ABC transporter substrate-binding protein [Chloroflexi bacterium]|nr:ABC transporter substrate-binding protein [Chloroflexota bacterium]